LYWLNLDSVWNFHNFKLVQEKIPCYRLTTESIVTCTVNSTAVIGVMGSAQWRQKIKFSGGGAQTKKGTNFHTGFLASQKSNVMFLCGKHFMGACSPHPQKQLCSTAPDARCNARQEYFIDCIAWFTQAMQMQMQAQGMKQFSFACICTCIQRVNRVKHKCKQFVFAIALLVWTRLMA